MAVDQSRTGIHMNLSHFSPYREATGDLIFENLKFIRLVFILVSPESAIMPEEDLGLNDFHDKVLLCSPHGPGGAEKVSLGRCSAERRLLLFPAGDGVLSWPQGPSDHHPHYGAAACTGGPEGCRERSS